MQTKVSDISKHPEVREIILKALSEDVGSGDHSSDSCIGAGIRSAAELIFKDEGIVAGIDIACEILRINDESCFIEKFVSDGEAVVPGKTGMRVVGNARALMKSERLLLNIMQRLSGIASTARTAVEKTSGYHTNILDTRKTTPNLRILEKWAVTVGGAMNHRFGLYDMIMLKDNHIDIAGGIQAAIQKAKQYMSAKGLELGIEVETRNLDEVVQVLNELPVQRIMLDNFTPEEVREAVKLIDGRSETEASGGINLDNIESYAAAGVDFISLGMLTHSVKSLDISFKIR